MLIKRTCKKELKNKKGKHQPCKAESPHNKYFFYKKRAKKLPKDYGLEG
jgi:hypothetical protein